MMTKYIKLRLILLVGIGIAIMTNVIAQGHVFEDYGFDDTPIAVPEIYKDKDEVTLFLKRKIDIEVDESRVVQFYLHHEKVLVNSDEAIERNNRIYVQAGKVDKFLFNKNRVILPGGKIIELSKDDIHQEVDPESGYKYEYYAVKGLEKGAILEKMYLLKEIPNFKGSMMKFQYNSPTVYNSFELYYPDHLIFDYKSYNGLAEAVASDSSAYGKKSIIVQDSLIDAASFDEKMANPVKYIKGFRYKLFENKANGSKNFYNYTEFVEGFYPNVSVEMTKKEKKALSKFSKKVKLDDDDKSKAWEIENYIKNNITYNRNFVENESLADMLKSRQSNLFYLLRLYREMLLQEGIKSEVVLTCDRYKKVFDNEFETTNHLDDALIYIPSIAQYIDPTGLAYRTPLFDYKYGNNFGVKIKEMEFGGSTMGIAELVKIEIPGMEVTSDTMRIVVDFTEDENNPKVESRIVFGGYAAANIQSIEDFVPPEQIDEIWKDIAKNYSADVELEKIETKNGGLNNLGKVPFEMKVNFDAEDLIQNAGNKILFSLGQIIGKQSEIYQEGERQYPVEIQYGHHYDRKITIILPEGYKVSNPEVLNMDYKTTVGDNVEAIFDCKYELEGNVLTITNEEYYNAINYPIEKYEDYRSVINAAADFNKIVLVLEK